MSSNNTHLTTWSQAPPTLLNLLLEIRHNIYTQLLHYPCKYSLHIKHTFPVEPGPLFRLLQTCHQCQCELEYFASRHKRLNLACFRRLGVIDLDNISFVHAETWWRCYNNFFRQDGTKRFALDCKKWKEIIESALIDRAGYEKSPAGGWKVSSASEFFACKWRCLSCKMFGR